MKLIAAGVLALLSMLCLWLFSTSTDLQFAAHRATTTLGLQQNLPHIEMTFAHTDHAKQQCVTCHHNYQDDTGQGLCLDCHHSDEELAFQMRSQFHELCMGCHQEKRDEGESSGPLRNCKACHTADHAP